MAAPTQADHITQRVVFALELLDPITGRAVSDRIIPKIKNLPPPVLTPSQRFVWRETGAPKARQVDVALEIKNPMFGAPSLPMHFSLPANDGTTAPSALLGQAVLSTTSRYKPPAGMTGVTGMIVSSDAAAVPVPGVAVRIVLSHDGETALFTSSHVAVTDANGEFCTVVQGLSDEKLDPDPLVPGALLASLVLEKSGLTKRREIVPSLSNGRISQGNTRLGWPDI
jgi:hypothetical protein